MKLRPSGRHINNELRVVKHFALFPTTLKDGSMIWLEYYYEEQKWSDTWQRWNEGTPYDRYQKDKK